MNREKDVKSSDIHCDDFYVQPGLLQCGDGKRFTLF